MRLPVALGGGLYYALGPIRTPRSPCGATPQPPAGGRLFWLLALRTRVGAQP
jgi:hypothetical protein